MITETKVVTSQGIMRSVNFGEVYLAMWIFEQLSNGRE